MIRLAKRQLRLEMLEHRRLLSVQSFAAQEQIVTPSPATQDITAGEPVTFDVNYSTSPPTTELTGLGLKMFYDSSKLEALPITNLLDTSHMNQQVQEDTADEDGDPSTDTFLLNAWSDPISGKWPGVDATTLYTANFTSVATATGSTNVRFVANSTAAGWTFASTPAEIVFLSTNSAPVVDAGSDATTDVGVAFTGTGSFTDPDADTWTATVDYGDGAGAESLSLTDKTFELSHTYTTVGEYTVTVAVDDGTVSGSDTLIVNALSTNTAPVVDAGSDATTDVGVAFTGTGSFTDPDADTWTATVDYGDGAGAESLSLTDKTFSLSHTYTTVGEYTVTVAVDDGTVSGSDTLIVNALSTNTAPVVDAGSDATTDVGVAFTGTGSFTDPDADTWTATVDYGDGAGAESLSLTDKTFELSHTYSSVGEYTVTVAVDDGTVSGSDTLIVNALSTNTAPVVDAGSDATTDVGVAFTGTGSFTDPDADTWTATVDYGDGAGAESLSLTDKTFELSHTYTTVGEYTVTVAVDDGTVSGSDTLIVNALSTNTAPVVDAGSDATTVIDVAFTGTGSFTDPDADTWTATVDYGDGAGAESLSLTDKTFELSHTYTAIGEYTVTVAVEDGTVSGSDSAIVTVTDVPVAEDLGVVDFMELADVNPSTGDVLYQLTTTRDGFLTLEALDPTVTLELLDTTGGSLATSTVVDSTVRIDYQVLAGETYLFRLSGSATEVDLRLANLVTQDGSAVTVVGTDAVDQFTVVPDTAYHVTINGVAYDFDPTTVATIGFDGGLGDDSAELTGTAGDDEFLGDPGSLSMTSAELTVTVDAAPVMILHGGGGVDRTKINDSDGDDTATLGFDETIFTGTSLDGQAFSFQIDTIGNVNLYARHGGNDVATMLDTTGFEKFKGYDLFSLLRSGQLRIRAKFFDEVYVDSTGGDDMAVMRDTMGDDHLTVRPDHIVFSFLDQGTFQDIRGFQKAIIYSKNDGNDTAEFHDSTGNDVFRGLSHKAHLYSLAADKTRIFDITAREFDSYTATATEGFDKARLYDAIGDMVDVFTGQPDQSSFIGESVDVTVTGFDRVNATSLGGNDEAFLFDTVGDDLLTAEAGSARIYGPDDAVQYLYEALDFESVVANGKAGGNNSKEIAAIDFALQLIDPSDWI